MLGSAEKTVLECELVPRREARRSLVLTREMKAGEIINIQGPLGHGFSTDVTGKKLLVVGGGMGMAPMKLLLNWIQCPIDPEKRET